MKMPDSGMTDGWSRIERWLTKEAPDVLSQLPRGATASEIAATEDRLGQSLPDDLRRLIAVHDGTGGLWLHSDGVLLSLAELISEWEMQTGLWEDGWNDEWAEPEGPIVKKWFSPGWVPVLGTWCGDLTCADLDPAEGGRRGQLISWYHNNGPTEVVYSSVSELIDHWAADLEAGLYRRRTDLQGRPYLEREATHDSSTSQESGG